MAQNKGVHIKLHTPKKTTTMVAFYYETTIKCHICSLQEGPITVKLWKSTVHTGGPKWRQRGGREGWKRKEWGGDEGGENGTWLVTKDNKKWLQGASRTQSGVNGPHLVPSQNAEETQIIGRTHTHSYTHTLSLQVILSLSLSPHSVWPVPGGLIAWSRIPQRALAHRLRAYTSARPI